MVRLLWFGLSGEVGLLPKNIFEASKTMEQGIQLLYSCVNEFLERNRKGRGENNYSEVNAILKIFAEIVEDNPLHVYSIEDANHPIDAVPSLPKDYVLVAKRAGANLLQLLIEKVS